MSKPQNGKGGPYAQPPKSIQGAFTTNGVEGAARLTHAKDPAVFLLDNVLGDFSYVEGQRVYDSYWNYVREYLNCLCDEEWFETNIVQRNDKDAKPTPYGKEVTVTKR